MKTRWFGLVLGALAALTVAAAPVLADQTARTAPPGRPGIEVDVQLILAVDVSLSMDRESQRIQRDGYVQAFRDRLVLDAIRGGPTGRIAVTYFEWSGDTEQRVVVDWTLIDGEESAKAFAERLATAPINSWRRTSISSAMMYASRLFDSSGYVANRRVIDVSGDGSNNEGPTMASMRDHLVQRGIIVNGLPLVMSHYTRGVGPDPVTLEMYYEACVISGPGSFLIPVRNMGEFRDALKTKLILEIAAIQPDPDHLNVIPASERPRPPVHCDGRYTF